MIYDVTRPLSPALGVWPGDPPITREPAGAVERWTMGNHSGTHVDAPAHVIAGGATIDRLDPDTLIGPCRVVDVPDVEHVTAGALPNLAGVTRLLLRTRNSTRRSLAFDHGYAALDADAVEAIVAAGVRLLGVDGPSPDRYGDELGNHRRLLAAGVVLIENLDLSVVPAGVYTLVCAPLLLEGADGAPARVWLTT